MVSKIADKRYKCSYCRKVYHKETEALACEKSHDVIYVPFKREDLFKLLQYIITHDDQLLSESLMRTLRNYSRGEYK